MAVKGATDLGDGCEAISVDTDPTTDAVDARAGSLIIYQGIWYRKRDDGSTTNVVITSLQSGSIVSGQISPETVLSGNIASGQIGQFHLSSGAVNSGHIGNNAVASGNIASGQISTNHLASGVIGTSSLTSGSVQSGHIGDNAVTSGNIASGQVVGPHLSSGVLNAISGSVTVGVTLNLLSGTANVGRLNAGLDLSIIQTLNDQSVIASWWGLQLKGNMQATTDHDPDNVGTPGQFSVVAPGQQAGAVVLGVVPSSGQVGDLQQWLGSGASSIYAAINASGEFRGLLASGIVISGNIGNGAVVSGSIASGQISTFHLASGVIGTSSLTSGAVQSGHIGNNAVTSGNIASGQIGQNHIASGAIMSGDIGNNAVTSGSIASGQITTEHLSSGATIEYTRNQRNSFTTAELISGFRAVSINSSGQLQIAMAGNIARMPAFGVVSGNIASGQVALVLQGGMALTPQNFSGSIGKALFVGLSGTIDTSIPSNTSGQILAQVIGEALNHSGMIVDPDIVINNDNQFVESTGVSTTTGAALTAKLSLTTPALTGKYLLEFAAEFGNSTASATSNARLQNTTDAVTYFDQFWANVLASQYMPVGGFVQVTFTGVAKTFEIQFARVTPGSTAQIRNARMRLLRIG